MSGYDIYSFIVDIQRLMWFVALLEVMLLFADAEVGEDVGEDLVGGEMAGDGAEGDGGGAEVLGDEVSGSVGVQAV